MTDGGIGIGRHHRRPRAWHRLGGNPDCHSVLHHLPTPCLADQGHPSFSRCPTDPLMTPPVAPRPHSCHSCLVCCAWTPRRCSRICLGVAYSCCQSSNFRLALHRPRPPRRPRWPTPAADRMRQWVHVFHSPGDGQGWAAGSMLQQMDLLVSAEIATPRDPGPRWHAGWRGEQSGA